MRAPAMHPVDAFALVTLPLIVDQAKAAGAGARALIKKAVSVFVSTARRALNNTFLKKRHAYRSLFLTEQEQLNRAAEIVLADLAKFCFAQQSVFVSSAGLGAVDPVATAAHEGRRQVFLRIAKHLNVSDRTVYRLIEEEAQHD